MATQRVEADQRPAQVEQGQQVGHGPEFLALALPGHLPQAQARGAGHGRDDVQRLGPGAAQGLAVHAHLARRRRWQHLVHPGHEARVEAVRVQLFEHAQVRVVGGRAVGQAQIPAQQGVLLLPEKRDFRKVVGPAKRGQHADGEHVHQKVSKVFILSAELRNLGQMRLQGHGKSSG